ncbi:GPI transamidase subunit PIG-U [Lentinula raphanica]|nr:GPI transamidase subunit PIG-U [Lentinula raphanica]
MQWPSYPKAIGFCIVLRLLLALSLDLYLSPPSLDAASSPLTLYANLKETLWLYHHGIDPYGSGTGQVGTSPLYLALSFFPSIVDHIPINSRILSKASEFLLWTIPDAFSAWFLVKIWTARAPSSFKSSSSIAFLLPTIYLLSPYGILPFLARSTGVWENAVLLGAIAWACDHDPNSKSKSLLLLALRTHLSLDAFILLPPLILLLLGSPESMLAEPRPFALRPHLVLEFMAYWSALTLISTLIVGHWRWMSATWGASLSLPSMTPNPGLWWYFFTEMFDHFRPFFLVVFNIHLLMYVAPICIKFQHDPLYALFILLGILATFKSYPTLSDHGLFIAFWAIFPEVYPYLRHPFPTFLVLLHSALLQPLFAHLWLSHGTGNANFYYASTLVGACAGGMAVVDAVWAGLRIAIEKAGKDVKEVVEGEEMVVVTQQ